MTTIEHKVSFGSKTVLTAPKRDFRPTSKNGHHSTAPACQFRANKRHRGQLFHDSSARASDVNGGSYLLLLVAASGAADRRTSLFSINSQLG
jgi:hypothetical protein